ncbi:MAG: pantetheine-phosphate adenylyltransferase [Chloroflexota bacterium]|nr:pantetheine-phosphate adenylyltransferase [Chloroflexota bacterium]
MVVALYPGSFDPFHRGHVDITERAAGLFDEVVVAIYDTPSKRLLFATDDRFRLAQASLAHLKNVRVVTYQNLTGDCARAEGATVIVRGLRTATDYDYESRLALANRSLFPDIDTVFLVTSPHYVFLSSTLLKEVAGLGGDFSAWVPPTVRDALLARFAQG